MRNLTASYQSFNLYEAINMQQAFEEISSQRINKAGLQKLPYKDVLGPS